MARAGFKRFKFSSAGYIKVMQSTGAQEDLRRRAGQIRAAMDNNYREPDGWEITADVQVGRTRARAIISGVPEAVETHERILGAALDAARR